jgi:hypothetical protein
MVRAPAITRVLLLVALLCAVSLRLLCPPGWMPNFEGRPGALLVICTGDGVHTVRDGGAHEPAPVGGKQQHDRCAFSGVAFAPAGSVTDLAPTAGPLQTAALFAPAGRRHSGPDWRRAQAPRAPPLAL